MEKLIFEKGFDILLSQFPDKHFDARAMWLLLSDLPNEKFLDAIIKICRSTKELYPGTSTTTLIREIALGCDNKMLSAEAFQKMIKAVLSVGSYGTPKFDDPILSKTVESMGWRSICLSDETDRSIIRAQFTKIYDSFLEREKNTLLVGKTHPIVKELVDKLCQQKQLKDEVKK